MKVTLFMAMSLNGIIARDNNEEDFLSHYGWEYFCKLAKKTGCFIIGRKTYDIVKDLYEGYGFDKLKEIVKVIVTRDRKFKIDNIYTIANSPGDALRKLKAQGFKETLLSGGSTINSSFAKENLIDEVIINIEPVIVGKGIPIFKLDYFDLNLKLLSIKRYEKSGITVKYSVMK
ncbi:dihydrofolate reductase family protein [Patescibacteria group bacterium]